MVPFNEWINLINNINCRTLRQYFMVTSLFCVGKRPSMVSYTVKTSLI